MAAIPHATARKGTGGGGFLAGMFVGLLVGLAVALGIALYLNKTPIPFMSGARPAVEVPPKPSALTGRGRRAGSARRSAAWRSDRPA